MVDFITHLFFIALSNKESFLNRVKLECILLINNDNNNYDNFFDKILNYETSNEINLNDKINLESKLLISNTLNTKIFGYNKDEQNDAINYINISNKINKK